MLLLVLAFTIFTVVDIALMDRSRVRGLPKPAWIAVAILLPVVGGVLWLAVGRVRAGDVGGRVRRPVAPDDDPEFLRRLNREKAMEDRIEQLEKELRDLDDEQPKD